MREELDGYVTGLVACDYLRVTTRYENEYELFKQYFDAIHYGDDPRVCKIMQFVSHVSANGLAIGIAYDKKGGFDTGLLQASGYTAYRLLRGIKSVPTSQMRATRIDLQLTIPYNAYKGLWDVLWGKRDRLVGSKGNRLSWRVIEDVSGLNTLYVGSRQSETFRRCYVKDIGEKRYIRFETEFKGKLANEILQTDLGQDTLNYFWLKSFDFIGKSGMPELARLLLAYANNEKETIIPKPYKEPYNQKWVEETLVPYLMRVIDFNPLYGYSVVQLLEDYCLAGDTELIKEYERGGIDSISRRYHKPLEEYGKTYR